MALTYANTFGFSSSKVVIRMGSRQQLIWKILWLRR
jgi:hypothetical protein